MGFFDSIIDSVETQFDNFTSFFDSDSGSNSFNSFTNSGNNAGGLANSLSDTPPPTSYPPPFPRDNQWVRLSFVLPTDYNNNLPLAEDDLSNRSFSSVDLKYTDTTVGGNVCINPPPQFTWYSDIHSTGYRGTGSDGLFDVSLGMKAGSAGMGRYYSEAIDDNNQIIHLSFGVPEYNSLINFFTSFYSVGHAALAKQGRYSEGISGSILRGIGIGIGICIAPLFLIPIAVSMVATAGRLLFGVSTSKYWTFKPTMHTYWMAVDGMVNKLSLYMGVNQPVNYDKSGGDSSNVNEISLISQFMPNEFSTNGRLNVLAISSSAKHKQLLFEKTLQKAIDDNKGSSNKVLYEAINNRSILISTQNRRSVGSRSLESYIQSLLTDSVKVIEDFSMADFVKESTTSLGNSVDEFMSIFGGGKDSSGNASSPPDIEVHRGKNLQESSDMVKKTFMDYWLDNEADGARWASFRVDYTGTVQESFSNTASEIATASLFNSISKKARETRISLADGNFADMLKPVTDAVGKILEGTADTLRLSGLHALMGNAYVDIPKMWDSSSTSINKVNYTMTLASPYGNPISQLINIYLPLCMLLAGTLPLATGNQSHTSPFVVQLHDRGRAIIRQGIIDSLSISRGTSNLGFTKEGKAMAIEVSFSVLDLSSIVSVALSDSISSILPDIDDLIDGENAMTDYLMALSGMTLHEATYITAKASRVWRQTKSNWENLSNPAVWGSMIANNTGVGLINSILRGSDKK